MSNKIVVFLKKYLYIILILSYLNTVLRIPGSSLTLFRIFLPITLLVITIVDFKMMIINIVNIIFFLLISVILTERYLIITNGENIYRIQSLNYLYFYLSIMVIYLIIKALKKIESNEFNYKFYDFLYKFNYFTIIISILQLIFKFNIPNTTSYRNTGITAFYWTENEVSVVLASFFPFLLIQFINEKKKKDLIPMILTIIIIYYNDSKIVLIGVLLQIILALFFYMNIKKKIIFLIFSISFLGAIILINPNIQFANSKLSFYEMISDPISRILYLKPYGEKYGSIYNRTDVLIYGLKEIKKNNFIGIGAGNSIYFIEKLNIFGSLKSPHNFLLQIILEYGFFSVVLIIYLIWTIIKKLVKHKKNNDDKVYLIFLLTFPIFSLGSSSGFFSLYYVFSVIIYLTMNR